jgi:hypothetical protein
MGIPKGEECSGTLHPLFTFCSVALRSGEFAIRQNGVVKSGEERVKRYK